MKWSKQDKRLIEKEIELYDIGIKAGFNTEKINWRFPLYECKIYYAIKGLCTFCPTHLSMKDGTCIACPNFRICNILGIGVQYLIRKDCFANRDYFIKHFNLETVEEEARFRRLMWRRALRLSEEKWLAIYKKEKR